MNNKIDLTNNGGFPLEQDTLDFMQQTYSKAFDAIANLVGDKTIIYGVESDGINVTAGWIVVGGELIPFAAGSYAPQVQIIEVPTQVEYEDGILKEAYFTKVAYCVAFGDFDFIELVPMVSLKNVWKKNDLRQAYVDSTYMSENFDVDGYGINAERGWRIFSKAVPEAAGKVLVNLDPDDADGLFDVVGKHGGEKSHTLQSAEQGTFSWAAKADDGDNTTGSYRSITAINFNGDEVSAPALPSGSYSPNKTVQLAPASDAHNILQPYFVVLTLIKL
ncbi:hypothetical protein ACFOWM_06330 [Ferruginibacter yonginensis]|uniref:Microcystin-dependent protein n=1 Tax=Ferruginibacter yonginensis TaxID=1310416 RepID=A0ABV8QU99_9BACT